MGVNVVMAKTVCCIGHRKIEITNELKKSITQYMEYLIQHENVEIFLFGSRSQFDDLCYKITSQLKDIYPHIKRAYIRSNYEYISDSYEKYLLKDYEETTYPQECVNSGKTSYLKRNQAMIDKSDYCIFYYNENYQPPQRKNSKRDIFSYQPKSGTALAYKYAMQKKKNIKNFYK